MLSSAGGCEPPSPGSTTKSIKAFSTRTTPGNNGKPKERLDRFIPSRAGLDVEAANLQLLLKENGAAAAHAWGGGDAPSAGEADDSAGEFRAMLLATGLSGGAAAAPQQQQRILAFRHKAPAPPEGHESGLRGLYTQVGGRRAQCLRLQRV